MFLLDTNIVSALAPTKRSARHDLAQWFRDAEGFIHFSVVTASEIVAGIAGLERGGSTAKADALRLWWRQVEHLYASRFLPVDLAVAHAAGRILEAARSHAPGYADVVIAATAEVHGLTVLTANAIHFRPLGVAWANPLDTLPPLPN